MGILQIKPRNKTGEKKPTRYYSTKQEEHIAQSLGGKRTPNSGATPFYKGDVTLDNWLCECKTKTSDSTSISIKKDWLDKLLQESLMMGKDNVALVFNFGPSSDKNYVIIDEATFKDLIDKNK